MLEAEKWRHTCFWGTMTKNQMVISSWLGQSNSKIAALVGGYWSKVSRTDPKERKPRGSFLFHLMFFFGEVESSHLNLKSLYSSWQVIDWVSRKWDCQRIFFSFLCKFYSPVELFFSKKQLQAIKQEAHANLRANIDETIVCFLMEGWKLNDNRTSSYTPQTAQIQKNTTRVQRVPILGLAGLDKDFNFSSQHGWSFLLTCFCLVG